MKKCGERKNNMERKVSWILDTNANVKKSRTVKIRDKERHPKKAAVDCGVEHGQRKMINLVGENVGTDCKVDV